MFFSNTPRFSGTNPQVWISSIERFLFNSHIPPDRYVEFAMNLLDGEAQSWAHPRELLFLEKGWNYFVSRLLWEFATPYNEDFNWFSCSKESYAYELIADTNHTVQGSWSLTGEIVTSRSEFLGYDTSESKQHPGLLVAGTDTLNTDLPRVISGKEVETAWNEQGLSQILDCESLSERISPVFLAEPLESPGIGAVVSECHVTDIVPPASVRILSTQPINGNTTSSYEFVGDIVEDNSVLYAENNVNMVVNVENDVDSTQWADDLTMGLEYADSTSDQIVDVNRIVYNYSDDLGIEEYLSLLYAKLQCQVNLQFSHLLALAIENNCVSASMATGVNAADLKFAAIDTLSLSSFVDYGVNGLVFGSILEKDYLGAICLLKNSHCIFFGDNVRQRLSGLVYEPGGQSCDTSLPFSSIVPLADLTYITVVQNIAPVLCSMKCRMSAAEITNGFLGLENTYPHCKYSWTLREYMATNELMIAESLAIAFLYLVLTKVPNGGKMELSSLMVYDAFTDVRIVAFILTRQGTRIDNQITLFPLEQKLLTRVVTLNTRNSLTAKFENQVHLFKVSKLLYTVLGLLKEGDSAIMESLIEMVYSGGICATLATDLCDHLSSINVCTGQIRYSEVFTRVSSVHSLSSRHYPETVTQKNITALSLNPLLVLQVMDLSDSSNVSLSSANAAGCFLRYTELHIWVNQEARTSCTGRLHRDDLARVAIRQSGLFLEVEPGSYTAVARKITTLSLKLCSEENLMLSVFSRRYPDSMAMCFSFIWTLLRMFLCHWDLCYPLIEFTGDTGTLGRDTRIFKPLQWKSLCILRFHIWLITVYEKSGMLGYIEVSSMFTILGIIQELICSSFRTCPLMELMLTKILFTNTVARSGTQQTLLSLHSTAPKAPTEPKVVKIKGSFKLLPKTPAAPKPKAAAAPKKKAPAKKPAAKDKPAPKAKASPKAMSSVLLVYSPVGFFSFDPGILYIVTGMVIRLWKVQVYHKNFPESVPLRLYSELHTVNDAVPFRVLICLLQLDLSTQSLSCLHVYVLTRSPTKSFRIQRSRQGVAMFILSVLIMLTSADQSAKLSELGQYLLGKLCDLVSTVWLTGCFDRVLYTLFQLQLVFMGTIYLRVSVSHSIKFSWLIAWKIGSSLLSYGSALTYDSQFMATFMFECNVNGRNSCL